GLVPRRAAQHQASRTPDRRLLSSLRHIRKDVLRRINKGETREEATLHYFRGIWGALPKIKPDGWPTILELRDWYVQQAYYYLRKESAVARHVGLDIRTVNSILRKDEVWRDGSNGDGA